MGGPRLQESCFHRLVNMLTIVRCAHPRVLWPVAVHGVSSVPTNMRTFLDFHQGLCYLKGQGLPNEGGVGKADWRL